MPKRICKTCGCYGGHEVSCPVSSRNKRKNIKNAGIGVMDRSTRQVGPGQFSVACQVCGERFLMNFRPQRSKCCDRHSEGVNHDKVYRPVVLDRVSLSTLGED
jgi:hypothetical protein